MKFFMLCFMFTVFFSTIIFASSVSWCDDFDYCSRDYQCRALVNVTSYGTMKLVPDFGTLAEQCGLGKSITETSLRVVSHKNTTNYSPYYYGNMLLFSTEKGPGLYYLYFSNETKPKSTHKLEYEWEEIQDCSNKAWAQQTRGNYLIFSTSGNDGYCDLSFNGWFSASISQAYYPDFMPMRFSYDVPSYGTADGCCNTYGGGGVVLFDVVSASPGGVVRRYTSNKRRCSGFGSYQVDDIIETTNATYTKAWGVSGAGNGQFHIKNYKAYVAKYDAEAKIMGVETPASFIGSSIQAIATLGRPLTIELKNSGHEDAKNVTLKSNIGILNETEITVIKGKTNRAVLLDLGNYEPGVYNLNLILTFDANGFEKIEKQILVYNETVHQSEAWISLTDFGQHSSFILNKTLHFVNNGTSQFNLSGYTEDFCFTGNESKLLEPNENRTLYCYLESSENLFVSEELSDDGIILNISNSYPYKINILHLEYLKSSEKEIENTTNVINGIDAGSKILVRVPFVNLESQQDQTNESYQGVQQAAYQQTYAWYYQPQNDVVSSNISSDAAPPSIIIISPENTTYPIGFKLSVLAEVGDDSTVECFVILNNEQQSMYIKNGKAQHTFLYIPEGDHNLTVKCTDSYGNSNEKTISFTSGIDEPDFEENNTTKSNATKKASFTIVGTAAVSQDAYFNWPLLLAVGSAAVLLSLFILHRYKHNSFRKFRKALAKKIKANRADEVASRKAHRAEEQKHRA